MSYGSKWSSFELMFLDDMVYKGWMGFQFTYVHKSVFVTK